MRDAAGDRPGAPPRQLKVVLIALIIALHAVLGYVGLFEAWTYAGVPDY